VETQQETDFYKVPLRTYLWLLVPAVLGVAVGVGLAHRSFHSAPMSAAPKLAPGLRPAPLPPARVYRTASTRNGLSPLRSTSELMADAVASGSLSAIEQRRIAETARGVRSAHSGTENVVTFDTRRNFAEAVGEAPPTNTSDGFTSTAPPAEPVNTTPIDITDVHTTSLTPFSATIAFHTSESVNGQIAYGLDAETLWTAWDSASQDHVAVVDGLSPNMTFRVWVNAHSADGRNATSPFLLTTPAVSGTPKGSTGGGAFRLDGQPYFPFVVWAACQDAYDREFAAGIDLFMGHGCGDPGKQLGALAGRGYLVTDGMNDAVPGAVATYLPDEWDTHLPNDISASAVRGMIPPRSGGPKFLTLTNHFYSQAAPLPQGRGMYAALIANADVLSFDLYPLQNWCRYDEFGHVFDSQRELVQLAAGKPTFQWIEARGNMDCGANPQLDPTPTTVHAETWLTIAAGAHAMGYFPYDFPPDIGAQIAREKHDIQGLVPALLDGALPAQAVDNSDVKVGARLHNGAIYVIAVNATRKPVNATINVTSLGDRQLTSLDRTRYVTAQNGSFQDTFGPLDVRIYISAPLAP
jgi:hypothetical protein